MLIPTPKDLGSIWIIRMPDGSYARRATDAECVEAWKDKADEMGLSY